MNSIGWGAIPLFSSTPFGHHSKRRHDGLHLRRPFKTYLSEHASQPGFTALPHDHNASPIRPHLTPPIRRTCLSCRRTKRSHHERPASRLEICHWCPPPTKSSKQVACRIGARFALHHLSVPRSGLGTVGVVSDFQHSCPLSDKRELAADTHWQNLEQETPRPDPNSILRCALSAQRLTLRLASVGLQLQEVTWVDLARGFDPPFRKQCTHGAVRNKL